MNPIKSYKYQLKIKIRFRPSYEYVKDKLIINYNDLFEAL